MSIKKISPAHNTNIAALLKQYEAFLEKTEKQLEEQALKSLPQGKSPQDLFSDSSSLSQIVRKAGLSQDIEAWALHEEAKSVPLRQHLPDRVIRELHDLDAKKHSPSEAVSQPAKPYDALVETYNNDSERGAEETIFDRHQRLRTDDMASTNQPVADWHDKKLNHAPIVDIEATTIKSTAHHGKHATPYFESIRELVDEVKPITSPFPYFSLLILLFLLVSACLTYIILQ